MCEYFEWVKDEVKNVRLIDCNSVGYCGLVIQVTSKCENK